MADVSHELGALRFVVDSPLSSKVSMFNQAANKHMESQLLNPFSESGGRRSPKFNKDEYGKPLAGSLTEMRGQKANIHVLKEMLELCQIIDSEGFPVQDEPEMRVILFGDLFNIYTHISDKVVGILLRARKHKLIDFEGEILFQHRDEDVPIVLLKPIKEIRKILTDKQEDIKRSASPAPQATTVLQSQNARQRSVSPAPNKKSTKTPSRSPSTEKRAVSPVALTNKLSTDSIVVLPKPTVLVTPNAKAAVLAPIKTDTQLTDVTSETADSTTIEDVKKSTENLNEIASVTETSAVEEISSSNNEEAPKESEQTNTEITESETLKLDQNNNNEANASKTPEVIVTVPVEETDPITVIE